MSLKKLAGIVAALMLFYGQPIPFAFAQTGAPSEVSQSTSKGKKLRNRKARQRKMKTDENVRPIAGGTPLRKGLWGGSHIRLEVIETGARLEFDCAHANISKPILVGSENQFAAEGVYVRESGGPEMPGSRPNTHPFRVTGQVEGDTMSITVTLTDSNQRIGQFTLRHGEESILVKCL